MGIYQRNKGRRGEQLAVNLLKKNGCKARRISMNESNRIDKGDVDMNGRPVSVKVGKQVPIWCYKAIGNGEALALVKRDRKEWLVIMTAGEFFENFCK